MDIVLKVVNPGNLVITPILVTLPSIKALVASRDIKSANAPLLKIRQLMHNYPGGGGCQGYGDYMESKWSDGLMLARLGYSTILTVCHPIYPSHSLVYKSILILYGKEVVTLQKKIF